VLYTVLLMGTKGCSANEGLKATPDVSLDYDSRM